MSEYYLAIDIGASSGRHMLGTIEDGKMKKSSPNKENNHKNIQKQSCHIKK